MPRTVSDDNTEDLMTDEEAEQWQEVATDFGTKIEWTKGQRFIGTFTGIRMVKVQGEDIEAAEFRKGSERYWSWMPFQLEYAVSNLKPGDQVFIECTGEDENAPVQKGRNKQLAFTVRVK